MANERTYNPLNEGYSGKFININGYTGNPYVKDGNSDKVVPPSTIKPLPSAIIKPDTKQSKKN